MAGVLAAVWPAALLLGGLCAVVAVWFIWALPALRLGELLRFQWWQLLWLLLFASGFVLRVRTTGSAAEDPLDSAAFYRVALVGIAVLGLQFYIVARRVNVLEPLFRGLFVLLTLFNVNNILSTLWSINPGWTLYRSLEHTVDVLVLVVLSSVLVTTQAYKRLFDWTWLLIGLTLGTVLLGALAWPEQAIEHGLGILGVGIEGVLPRISRNGVGGLGAIVTIVAISRIATGRGSRRLYWGVVLIGLTFVLVSQTRSVMAPLCLAIPLVLLISGRIGLGLGLPLLAIGLLMLTGAGDLFGDFWQRHETAGQLATFNGRLNYWSYAWELVLEQPLTGLGAFAGGRFVVAQQVGHDTLSSSHGTYPEILVGTGFPGLVIVLLLLGAVWFYIGRRALEGPGQNADSRLAWTMAVEAVGVLTVTTGRSIFDVDLIWHPALHFLAIVAFAQFLRTSRQQEEATRRVSVAQLPAPLLATRRPRGRLRARSP